MGEGGEASEACLSEGEFAMDVIDTPALGGRVRSTNHQAVLDGRMDNGHSYPTRPHRKALRAKNNSTAEINARARELENAE